MLDAFCLALALYVEARGEPPDGQYLVAEVVKNRVTAEGYPDTVCEVVYQPHQFGVSSDVDFIVEDPVGWHMAVLVAVEALETDDMKSTATHYHANYMTPDWADDMTKLGKYGGHTFYEEQEHE